MTETEARIQSEMVEWYNNKYCLMFHTPRCIIFSVPNGGERTAGAASVAKSTGEYSGASDLFINHFGRWISVEVKTPTGTQSKAQKIFQAHIEATGTTYYIIRSLLEFQLLIHSLTNNVPYNNVKK